MARWKSKAQIEAQANEAAKRQVVDAVKEQVAGLVATWEEKGYPTYGECEKELNSLIRENGILDSIEKNVQYAARVMAVEYFMDNKGISKVLRERQRLQEKEKREAFKLASANRLVVKEGMFRYSMSLGEIGIIGSKDQQRILVCLSCEFIRAPRDMTQDEDGYYIKLAEPTDEEKKTEAYLQAAKKVAGDIAYEQRELERFEARRQAELDAIRASGREPDIFEDIFAGTSED
jgi:hypothetical protein